MVTVQDFVIEELVAVGIGGSVLMLLNCSLITWGLALLWEKRLKLVPSLDVCGNDGVRKHW